MWTWILRWKFGSRLDPGLDQIGDIGPLLIPVSTIKFLDSRYQSQSRGILNFLVSIDPNLEWIGKKISNPSPSLDQKIFGLQVPIPISRNSKFSSFFWSLSWVNWKKISSPSPSLDQKIFGLHVPIPISRWFQIFLVSIDPNLKEITNFRANFLKS